nr:unnamed protein product [Spirometra erinaceieuropaei]
MTFYCPTIKGIVPLLNSDGTAPLAVRLQTLERTAEHFRTVFNHPSTTPDATIDRFPQAETNNELDLSLSLRETTRTVQQLSTGKAPGSNVIAAKIDKLGGLRLAEKRKIFNMWRSQNPKNATIVYLLKRKGYRQFCDNHRGSSQLNIVEVYARILPNRLNVHQE